MLQWSQYHQQLSERMKPQAQPCAPAAPKALQAPCHERELLDPRVLQQKAHWPQPMVGATATVHADSSSPQQLGTSKRSPHSGSCLQGGNKQGQESTYCFKPSLECLSLQTIRKSSWLPAIREVFMYLEGPVTVQYSGAPGH
jgi:hypothetical protein